MLSPKSILAVSERISFFEALANFLRSMMSLRDREENENGLQWKRDQRVLVVHFWCLSPTQTTDLSTPGQKFEAPRSREEMRTESYPQELVNALKS
jgi:hypothetical protein